MAVFPPTDWGDWVPGEYAVGAPATAYSFERWFRNPVAMAQGADGAPKIVGRAVQAIAAGVSGVGTTPATLIGLGDYETLLLCLTFTSEDAKQVSYSTDNGTSWGGWFTIGTTEGSYPIMYSRTLNSFVATVGLVMAAPPVGMNGVRFRHNGGSGSTLASIVSGGALIV